MGNETHDDQPSRISAFTLARLLIKKKIFPKEVLPTPGEDTGLPNIKSGGKSPTGETRVSSGKVLPEIPPEESQEE